MNDAAGLNDFERRPFELVVYERKYRRQVRLPSSGDVLIGRSADCDVRLEDCSISRRHAVLHMSTLEVEDLSSKNGSWLFMAKPGLSWESIADGVSGEGLKLSGGARRHFGPGSMLKLGSVIFYLQHGTPVMQTEPVPEEVAPCEDVVLEDPEMMRVYELAGRVATTILPVLLLGETGVGKDVLAEHIHRSSPRRSGPLVRVNCGALSESLLESELFGHQRGAFTGAQDAKPGLLELGHGGTVFLDEIGELPLQMQVKLLHVLETGEVTRVGGTRTKRIDVRFVAATNRELAREVQAGRFRKDLYFRINAICLKISPLRKRKDEIAPLARYFLRRFCAMNDIPEPELSPDALRQLLSYSWPGNVRELKNAMERAPILCGAGRVMPQHLPMEAELTSSIQMDEPELWQDHYDDESPTQVVSARGDGSAPPNERIAEALRRCGGNQTRAARLLGISRRTLVNRLTEYNLPRPRKRVV